MVRPVFECRPSAIPSPLHILAEGYARRFRQVGVMMVADKEIHRNVQCIFDVILEAAFITKDKRWHARAISVGVVPDMSPVAVIAVQAAIGDWRVGEEGIDEWNQAHTNAEF